MMNIRFRSVAKEDLPKFVRWYQEIEGHKLFSNYIPTTFSSFAVTNEQIIVWYIILLDNKEIGTIWFEKKVSHSKEIDLGLYLNDTKLMGKGLGKIIIRKGVDGIRKQVGKIPICLDVRLTNNRAIRCYEALGFRKVFEAEKITPTAKIKYQRMVLEV